MVNHPNRRPKTYTVKIGPLPRRIELHQVMEAITEEIWARGYTPERREKINIENGRGVTSINFSILED